MPAHRRRAIAAGAAAAMLVAAAAAGAAAAATRLQVEGTVAAISAAGPRVAIQVHTSACDRILVWHTTTGLAAPHVKQCNTEGVPVLGLERLLLAGTRLVWSSVAGGNITEEALLARRLGTTKTTVLASAASASDGFDGDDTYLGNVAGRGSAFSAQTLVAWNTWHRCTVAGPNNELGCPAPPGSPLPEGSEYVDEQTVRILTAAGRRTVLQGAAAGPVVAVGAGLIALRLDLGPTWEPLGAVLPAGTVTLVDTSGAVVGQLPVPGGVWGGAELTQSALVALVDQTLHVIDRATGVTVASWPVVPSVGPGTVRLTSVSPQGATVVSARQIQVVRLADGAVVRLGGVGVPGTLDAELEAQGLYVAWAVAGSTPRRSLVQLRSLASVGLAPGGA